VQSQGVGQIIRDHPPIRILHFLGTFCEQVNECTPVILRHALKESRDRLQEACSHIWVDDAIVSQIDRYDYVHEGFGKDALKIRHGITILVVMFATPDRTISCRPASGCDRRIRAP
jgi:hypothetical protein